MSVPRYAPGDPAPKPLALRSEAQIIAHWTAARPLVSVLCPTYEHVGFIDSALSGFLGQDTSFPFEVIVRDDASTDGTAEIVHDYGVKYPNIIRTVLETENRYPQVSPVDVLWRMAQGDFIAICEGDDYWTDARGLQKLVEALENNPHAIAVHHAVVDVENGHIVRPPDASAAVSRGRDELLTGRALSLRSTLIRRDPHFKSDDFLRYVGRVWAFDRFLANTSGRLGDLLFVPGVEPAVYRSHSGGVSSLLRIDLETRSLTIASDRYWTAMYLYSMGEEDAADVQMWEAFNRMLSPQKGRSRLLLRVGVGFLRSWIRTQKSALRRVTRGRSD